METKEKRFESDIESFMISKGGYIKGNQDNYDKEKSIDLELLINFVKTTQPKQWKRYEFNYGDHAEEQFYKRFQDSVNRFGLIHVIKHGFKDRGAKIKIAYFKENTTLSETVIKNYNSNILTCIRQFKYSPYNNNSIDIVLSLNGIPIVAMELKDQLTGQNIIDAKEQFMFDRDQNEFCFQFNNRFLVYFAVDLNEAAMTTKLDGKNTYFLPFNQGSGGAGNIGGAGNPENLNGYTTSYLWEYVLNKDSLMDILHNFIQKTTEDEVIFKNGKEIKKTKTKIIFPRYHQLDVVRKLVMDVKKKGSGHNYLIQHSAGSGKSNSIAWLAYQLSELHDEEDHPIFTSIIVINDRTVLDKQTQDTIYGFDHVKGVVMKIDDKKDSSDLKNAINAGKKIIITTLQKFPHIYDELDDNSDKRFAIIIDEAHSSQSGKSAQKLKIALANTADALKEYAELEEKTEDEILDSQDEIVNQMLSHGRHKNLSFFAFTATPKQNTLEQFGEVNNKSKRGYVPFHVYSMRQAIEEEFILDVLKNYVHYKTYYKIVKDSEDNPEVPVNRAMKEIVEYKELHQHNINEKSRIIVETYRNTTQHKIKGKAKAMLVTASRLHAVMYYQTIKKYVEENNYNINLLIAFSGEVDDGIDTYSEEKLNKRIDGTIIREKQLPAEFHKDKYGLLIVADKYQTGFDEPLLHTMFVDKKLKGIKAVQTLSRLNRTHPDKEDTFILDFVNDPIDIQKYFEDYYDSTILDEAIDVNMIYDTKLMLRSYNLYSEEDIDTFLNIFMKKEEQTATDLGRLTSLMQPIINRYTYLPEDKRFEFTRTLRNFNKWYAYIVQITRIFDKDLQREYAFTKYLDKMLPPAKQAESVNLDGKLKLEYYRISKDFEGSISLSQDVEPAELKNPKEINPDGRGYDEEDLLENLINKINERNKGVFRPEHKVMVKILHNRTKDNEKIKRQAMSYDKEMFLNSIFPETFDQIAQECYEEHTLAFAKLFQDKQFYRNIMTAIGQEIYNRTRLWGIESE